MKILFVTSEVTPYSKTGGLADVSAGLPQALAEKGAQIKVISPRYRSVAEAAFPLRTLKSPLHVRFRNHDFADPLYVHRIRPELSYYFIRRDEFYDRTFLYGTPDKEYFDNADRFIFFGWAVLAACRLLRFHPDIIHCNDWPSALIPAMLKSRPQPERFTRKIRTVFTIHNLAYQGIFPQEIMPVSGLPPEYFSTTGLEFYGKMNFLKAGIVFSDRITTVSKTYAKEILKPEFGHGLDGVLRDYKFKLQGLLNGADYSDWDPSHDPFIAQNYNRNDLRGKELCKGELRQIFGLTGPPSAPLLGMVARLVEQKGLDLVVAAVDRLLRAGTDLVILGTGEERFQKELSALARHHRGRIGVRIGFDPALAHKIEAGSDMFLMPSRYEPCGLNQIYSLRYGTIPLVHATGGLEDTIREFNPNTGKGNGFKFKPYSAPALMTCVHRALSFYRQPTVWNRLVENAMQADFSWDKAAVKYLQLYQKVLA